MRPPIAAPKKAPAMAPAMAPADNNPAMGSESEPDEAAEAAAAQEYCESRRQTCVQEFRRLIESMKQHGVGWAMMTNHPSYNLSLRVCKHDGNAGVDIHSPSPGCPDGFDGYIWPGVSLPFFTECWAAAEGPNSGKRAFVFENGMGDVTDLCTGEEPIDRDVLGL